MAFERDQPGFVAVDSLPTLTAAIAKATTMNDHLGLTSADVADIHASSLAATWPASTTQTTHNTQTSSGPCAEVA